MKFLHRILLFGVVLFFFSCSSRKVESSRGYYPTGEIRYEVKTVFFNHIDEFHSDGKKIVRLVEYGKDGTVLFKEKKVFPSIIHEEHLSDMRHIMPQPYIRRKYVKYNNAGKKIEKHKLRKFSLYKNIKYDYDQYRKVIKKNDLEGDVKVRKVGNRRKSIKNKFIDPGYK